MLISIITVNYNDAKGLERTIKSVQSQTYQDFEHIIIDGNSDDGSKEIIEKHKDSFSYWVSEPDSGIYNAMNKGIDVAKGEYLLFLNSGDWLFNDKVLEKFISFKPKEDIVYGDVIIDQNNKLKIKKMPLVKTIGDSLTTSLNHQVIFFSYHLFENESRYDCSYNIVADWVFINNSIINKKCTLKYIEMEISVYNLNGVSNNAYVRKKERKRYIHENFDKNFINLLDNYINLKNSLNKKPFFLSVIKRFLKKISL